MDQLESVANGRGQTDIVKVLDMNRSRMLIIRMLNIGDFLKVCWK